ncbi:MAG: hypothetical protein ACFE9N_04480 [Promethearchaeota archaeon]
MIFIVRKEILEKLKDKKISVYVKDVTERSWFSGVLEEVSDDIIQIREKANYSECRYYILISEIVVISESLT